jgi:predicted phosphodiesterase
MPIAKRSPPDSRRRASAGHRRLSCLATTSAMAADPEWTVTTVMDLVDNGAIAVRGNHDDALVNPQDTMNWEAQIAIEWTRGRTRSLRVSIPSLTVTNGDRLYVHSDASKPSVWHYVTNSDDASRSIEATVARVTFCGHVHRPQLYTLGPTGRVTSFTPITDSAIPLSPNRRWLAVLGSVGQPRDGDSAASYAVLDIHRCGPIVAVAVDLTDQSGVVNEALRTTAKRILATLPSARLACLNVLKIGRITVDFTLDERSQQADRSHRRS